MAALASGVYGFPPCITFRQWWLLASIFASLVVSIKFRA